MGRTPKNVSDNDAIEITKFLLNKDIPQTQIAMVVKRSQSWVSGIKREEMHQEAVDDVTKKASNENNTVPFQFKKASDIGDN